MNRLVVVLAIGLAAFGLPGAASADTQDCPAGVTPTHIGTTGDDVIRGTNRIDIIVGLGGKDTIHGLGEMDLICGGSGADRIVGGAGMDFIITGEGRDVASGGAAFDLLAEYSETRASFPFLLAEMGDGSTDRLSGGADTDLFVPEGGDDVIAGGPGEDIVDVSFSWSPTVLNLEEGFARSENGGNDTLSGVEHAVGGVYGDVLIGSDDANLLAGWHGEDHVDGGPGSDLLVSEVDGERLFGGDDQARDTVVVGLDEAVKIDLSIGSVTPLENPERPSDILMSIEDAIATRHDDVVVGSAGENVVVGAGGSDDIAGGDGDDVLVGDGPIVFPFFGEFEVTKDAGRDQLDGGGGDDRLDGGPKRDKCVNGESLSSCEAGQKSRNELRSSTRRVVLPWWWELLPLELGVGQLPLHAN